MIIRQLKTWFYVSPDDRVWMRRRLGKTGMCLLFLMTFSAVVQDRGPISTTQHADASIRLAAANSTDDRPDVREVRDLNVTRKTEQRRDLEAAIASARQPKAVPPSGWRRTNRGWEKVDSWAKQFPHLYGPSAVASSRTLEDWIDHHQQERPGWVELSFAQLRRIPPLGIAGLQIIAIWLISRQARPQLARPQLAPVQKTRAGEPSTGEV